MSSLQQPESCVGGPSPDARTVLALSHVMHESGDSEPSHIRPSAGAGASGWKGDLPDYSRAPDQIKQPTLDKTPLFGQPFPRTTCALAAGS